MMKSLGFATIEPLKAHVRRVFKSRELKPVRLLPTLRDAPIVAVLVLRDEAPRIPFLLDYYRRLGVDHFLIIDNQSVDGTEELLLAQPDVSIYRARGLFARARYGMDWVNCVLSRHCAGKWILHVDADEFLVFAGASMDLPNLCERLQKSGLGALQTTMVDMYSAGPAITNVVGIGQDPLEICDRFDASGYTRHYNAASGTTWIKGGVRGRLFFEGDQEGPALNKTPLIRWRRRFAFLKCAHEAWPRSLNGANPEKTRTGALLHFKFTSLATSKMTDPRVRAQHTAEYDAYSDIANLDMHGPSTTRYRSPEDLVQQGLLAELS